MLAFGLARLHADAAAEHELQNARNVLKNQDAVHAFLLGAFTHRIGQALRGEPAADPWPAGLQEAFQHLERAQRYIINRMQAESRILAPAGQVDPYLAWRELLCDELGRTLASLAAETDGDVLAERIEGLLSQVGSPRCWAGSQRTRVLTAALDLVQRLPESLRVRLLVET